MISPGELKEISSTNITTEKITIENSDYNYKYLRVPISLDYTHFKIGGKIDFNPQTSGDTMTIYTATSPSYTFSFYTEGQRNGEVHLGIYDNKHGQYTIKKAYINLERAIPTAVSGTAHIPLAEDPTEDGTYTLKLIKAGSSFTYKWVKDAVTA